MGCLLLQSCRFNICNSEASLSKSEGILYDRVCTCNPNSCGQLCFWYSFAKHFSGFFLSLEKNLLLDGCVPGMNFNARIKIRYTP